MTFPKMQELFKNQRTVELENDVCVNSKIPERVHALITDEERIFQLLVHNIVCFILVWQMTAPYGIVICLLCKYLDSNRSVYGVGPFTCKRLPS